MTPYRRRLHTLSVAALLFVVGCPDIGPIPVPTADWSSVRVDNGPSILPVAVDAFDMDGDLDLDIVSIWRGQPVDDADDAELPDILGLVAIHLQGNSPTTWTTIVVDESEVYDKVNSVEVADINQDGNPDILIAAHDRITYLRAPDDPTETGAWTIYDIASSVGEGLVGWFDATAGQIDGDNGLDIAAALSREEEGRVVWFQSPVDPDTSDGWNLVDIDAQTRSFADSVALIDLDGDTDLDLVSTAPGETSNGISWYENRGSPATAAWTKHPMSSFAGATRFTLADFNLDNNVDLAAVSPADLRVAWMAYPTNVTDRWSGWVLADFSQGGDQRIPVDIVSADIDQNGRPDAIVATNDPDGIYWFTPGSNIRLDWTESKVADLTDLVPALIDTGDIDADNDPDVVVPVNDLDLADQDRVLYFVNPFDPAATQPS